MAQMFFTGTPISKKIWLINHKRCGKIINGFSCASTRNKAALVGELAVPCDQQPATAGMNPGPRRQDVPSAPYKQR